MLLYQVIEVPRDFSAYFALTPLFVISTRLYCDGSTIFCNISRTCFPVFTVLSILWINLSRESHGAHLCIIFVPAVVLLSLSIEPVELLLLFLLYLVLNDVLEAYHFW